MLDLVRCRCAAVLGVASWTMERCDLEADMQERPATSIDNKVETIERLSEYEH